MSRGDNEATGQTGAEGASSASDNTIASESMAADAGGDPSQADGSAAGAPGSSDTAADVQRQFDEQRDKYLRLAAEYDNFRKRTARERTESATQGQAELIRHIIDALDDLSRFAHVDPDTAEARTVVQGVEMVERKLLKALTTLGLAIVNPENSSFDPELHEAVGTEPAASQEDDHVVSRVYQPGYVFNGKLLRPARVVVKQWGG
jgi:molecular chaperone GrpE